MNESKIEKITEDIDHIYRQLARVTIGQLLGAPHALSTTDVLEAHPVPLESGTLELLQNSSGSTDNRQEALRMERLLFGCMDLAVTQETAQLTDMLNFFVERCWMHVGSEKIHALEVVPWLQAQPDFDKREEMKKENSILLKGLVNPVLTGIMDLTLRLVTQRLGFENYVRFAEAKKQISFDEKADLFENFLNDTEQTYYRKVSPWIEEKIGRSPENLSRYHALYLVRIARFDSYFPMAKLKEIVDRTFLGLGFDFAARPDVIFDISDGAHKNPEGMCVGVEIPGEVYVVMKPMGGLIDFETLLHEAGHAFFLSHFDPELPVEYRRLYRSPSLDETFAFLFMDLVENREWLTGIVGMPPERADELADLYRTKRLCLIRRHIGKFLAEKEFHEMGDVKNSQPYCRHLRRATGFVYEPEAYLADMDRDFYALDYLEAWAGAHVLRGCLEDRFGEAWFRSADAGDFLRQIAASGRCNALDEQLVAFCGAPASLPTNFAD